MTSNLRHNLLRFLIKMGKSVGRTSCSINPEPDDEFRKLVFTRDLGVDSECHGFVINTESVDRIVMADGSGLGPALSSDWSVCHTPGL